MNKYIITQDVEGYRELRVRAKNKTELRKGNYEVLDSDTTVTKSSGITGIEDLGEE